MQMEGKRQRLCVPRTSRFFYLGFLLIINIFELFKNITTYPTQTLISQLTGYDESDKFNIFQKHDKPFMNEDYSILPFTSL